jgi:hypothetical protein
MYVTRASRKNRSMSNSELNFEKLRQGHEAAKVGFIITELDLAITFADRAKSADEDETASRNLHNAERAYDAAKRFLQKADGLDANVAKEIETKIKRLQELLEDADHHLNS